MSMITVDGSANDNNEITFSESDVTYNDTDGTSQIDVIKAFMAALDNSNKNSSIDMLDEAIKACSNFEGINDAVNHFLYDASIASSASDFLTNYCGIIVGGNDTGAITGSDAGGSTAKNGSDIVPETGNIDTGFTDTSFTSNGLTLTLGSSYDSSSDAHKTIWQALKTWWVDGALNLISDSYGSNYGFSTASSATIKEITVQFTTDSSSSALASVGHTYDTGNGRAASLTLNINMHYYSGVTSTSINSNKDGASGSSGSMYLDRVLAHEFTHAVMAANINWFSALPLWIIEGMAELTHGIDDVRGSISILANNTSLLTNVVKSMSNDSKDYTSDYAYSGGFMFLRWLAKNYNSGDVLYGTEYNDNDTKQGKGKSKKLYRSINNTGNNKTIYALAGNDKITNSGSYVTVVGGTGNDTINLNGSSETVVYSSGDGKDVLIGFGESDSISIAAGAITTSTLKKNNVILTVGKGTITLNDAKGQLLNVIDADGNLSTKMYGKGTVTVQGFNTNDTIEGWAKADSLNGANGDDTLIGGKGNDSLTGGSGADIFYYAKGHGKDVITDYTAGEDVIVLDGVSVTKSALVKKSATDMTFTVTKGSIRVNNAVGNRITFKDTSNNTLLSQTFGTSYMNVTNSDFATINTAIDATVLTVDASARTNDVMLIGNAKDNYIKLSNGNINETVTTGKGKDTVEYLGGNATITDYTAGSDVIKFTNSEIVSAKFNSSNEVVFTLKDTGTTTATSTLTLQNMLKKKKVQKVTVIDKDGITYAQTFGDPILTIGNGDGDTVIANSDVTVMNAAKRTKAVYLIGNEYDGTIKGGTKDDTISAGLGNDYVTGGKGNDLFIFSGGKDTIGDYSAAKNNMDAITLSSYAFDNYYVDGKNVVMTFKNGGVSLQESDTSLTIVNGKDKEITVNGAARVYNDYYEKIFAKKDTTATYNAAGSDDSLHTAKLIDASKKTSSIYITGNNFNDGTISTIKGGTKADTIKGGTGSDILTGGKGADLFIYADGNDTVTDYTAGTDIISFDGASLLSASYNSNDLVFTTDKGTLTIQKAIKKKKDQKITILDGKDQTAQVYGRDSLTIGASDGATVDLRRAVNSEVTTVNASGRGATAPIVIYGNTKSDNITGSKGDDTIVLSTDTGRGKATITYTAGNDKITNFGTADILTLSKGQTAATATKVSDTNYKITINNSKKKAVGTLDISGIFTTSLGTSATYKGTGTDTDTYYDITNYVDVGGNKVAYDVQSKVKVTSATYEERFDDYLESVDIFGDTVLSTAYELNDLTSIKDSSAVLDYTSPPTNVNTSALTNEFDIKFDISSYNEKIDKNK